MNSIRDHIRAVIGGVKKSGITDKEIDDASWEYYFDLDQTMDHILGLPVAHKSLSHCSYGHRGSRKAERREGKTR
jgi:hypothetical protein